MSAPKSTFVLHATILKAKRNVNQFKFNCLLAATLQRADNVTDTIPLIHTEQLVKFHIVEVFAAQSTAKVMSIRSLFLGTIRSLFLGRLRPTKLLTST